MSKFNTKDADVLTSGVITSTPGQTEVNHEGLPAFGRDVRSDLFLLGVTNFVSEDTFYEDGTLRDTRFRNLVHEVTIHDPSWVRNFVRYLREDANMRSAAVVAAVEYVRAGGEYGRRVIDSACARADEPGEVLAYYTANYGRKIPAAVKRGVADAARRLYNEYSYLKYDSDNSAWRWADVLQVAHAKAGTEEQNSLFAYVLDSYYKGKDAHLSAEALPMLGKNRDYRDMPKDVARAQLLKRPEVLKEAGLTWEALSSYGPMDKDAWEAVIPQMGYMALLRNLRNFDEAGVSDEVAAKVAARLSDPEQVAKSRQLVFRFYSAYINAPSLRWGQALETALDLAVKNIPVLGGKTLILVDTSASMTNTSYSAKSTVAPVQAAALFGAALAKAGQEVDLRMFAEYVATHEFPAGGSVLKTAASLVDRVGEVGHKTNIGGALDTWSDHDRIVLLSDLQTTDYVSRTPIANDNRYNWGYGYRATPGGWNVPTRVPIYGFNLDAYGTSVIDSEQNMYEFGGLTDGTFSMINALERGRDAKWPWDE